MMGVVIPAPVQVRGELQRKSRLKTLDSPVSSTGQAYQVRNDKVCKVFSEKQHEGDRFVKCLGQPCLLRAFFSCLQIFCLIVGWSVDRGERSDACLKENIP